MYLVNEIHNIGFCYVVERQCVENGMSVILRVNLVLVDAVYSVQ